MWPQAVLIARLRTTALTNSISVGVSAMKICNYYYGQDDLSAVCPGSPHPWAAFFPPCEADRICQWRRRQWYLLKTRNPIYLTDLPWWVSQHVALPRGQRRCQIRAKGPRRVSDLLSTQTLWNQDDVVTLQTDSRNRGLIRAHLWKPLHVQFHMVP